MMSEYRLDRAAFKAQTAREAANHTAYYKTLTWQERLKIAGYLNSIAYNYPENDPLKMDRTAFSYRSHDSLHPNGGLKDMPWKMRLFNILGQ